MRYKPWLPLLLACRTAGDLASAKKVACKQPAFKAMRAANNTYKMLREGESDAEAEANWRWVPCHQVCACNTPPSIHTTLD